MRFRDFLRRRKSPLPAAPGGAVTVEQPESDGASSDKKPAKTDGENKDAGSSLVRSDVQHQQPSQVSDASGKLYSWDSLWAEAYETVKEDAESSELLREFEKKLIEDGGLTPRDASAGSEGAERLQLIQRHAVRKLERLPETQLAFSFYEKRIVVRKLVLKAIQVISTFKPIITAAVSAEPHAALAWAGIMTILPMLETAFQQDEDAANGLNSIVFLLVQYQDIQETSLVAEFKEPSRSDATQQLLLAMRTKLVSIYAQIYVYQIRFVLQFARGAVHQTMRNLTSADSWKQMWEDIKAASDLVKEGIQSRVGARTFETWKAVNDAMKRMDGIEALQQATLTAVQDGNETNLLLSLPSAENALFDSAEIVRAEASCMEGTQRRILNDIQDWAESPSGEVVFWLHGMAGTGKTSVALTVANALCGRKPFTVGGKPPSIAVLGASFFFKQSDATRNSTRNFFPTLARCLAKVFPDLKSLIVGAITQDLEIGTKAPRQQLNDLIVRPLIRLDEQICLPIRLIVVVDALDECVERTEAKELIEMLAVLEARLHQVQLRFLITSRREELIVRGFSKLPNSLYRSLLLGKIQPARDGDINRDDIALYLSYTLAEIASRNDVSQQWIGEAGIKQLCEKADGLFIYAATACRFLDAPDFTDEDARRERLDLIVHDEEDADAPQQKVDEIYLKVLSFPHLTKSLKKTKARHLAQISKILGFIAILLEPVSALSLGHLVSIPRATLDDWLTRLHSIVSVPQDEMSPLGLVHLSFRDFILSEERSRLLEFRVEESTMHEQIFQRCLDLMSDMLCQDICGLVLTGTLASEVPQSQIKQSIPQHLQYACRYWVDHLAKLDDETRMREGLMDQGKVHTFLQKSFLYWLEAMSLIRETPTTILMINRLQTLMNPSEHGNLCSLVYDAKRFILSNRWIISHAPLQIYASALIFAPEKSLIRAQFKHMMPPWIIKRPAVEQYWTAELNTLEGHTDFITSIAFSPSDDLVATGSLDGTTRLWDYVTGTERLKFDDKKKINCVAFSRDGKSVASALPREVMRVRKFAKGSMIELKPQGGRMGRITQVAFSGQDDNTLASITADRKLRVWNVDQRREIHICEILEDNPFAVPTRAAFSPDGKFVVVGPNLGRPILWSVETGKFVKTLELYEGVPTESQFIDSASDYDGLAFSRDGKLLATASMPEVHLANMSRVSTRVQVWDMTSIVGKVSSRRKISTLGDIKFLPNHDDSVLAQFDTSMQLWNATDGCLQSLPTAPFGHVGGTNMSPDGRYVVLKEQREMQHAEEALQLWDSSMTKQFFGSERLVDIMFSPDSNHIALASRRGARIIDGKTMKEKMILDVDRILSFAFSPNGQIAALIGGKDGERMFELWEVANKTKLVARRVQGPFHDITFSPDGQLAAVSEAFTGDPKITLFEVETGKERGVLANGHWYVGSSRSNREATL